jgi:hypothetical protein
MKEEMEAVILETIEHITIAFPELEQLVKLSEDQKGTVSRLDAFACNVIQFAQQAKIYYSRSSIGIAWSQVSHNSCLRHS